MASQRRMGAFKPHPKRFRSGKIKAEYGGRDNVVQTLLFERGF